MLKAYTDDADLAARGIHMSREQLRDFWAQATIDEAAQKLWDKGYSLDAFDKEVAHSNLTNPQYRAAMKIRDALEEIVDDERREDGDD